MLLYVVIIIAQGKNLAWVAATPSALQPAKRVGGPRRRGTTAEAARTRRTAASPAATWGSAPSPRTWPCRALAAPAAQQRSSQSRLRYCYLQKKKNGTVFWHLWSSFQIFNKLKTWNWKFWEILTTKSFLKNAFAILLASKSRKFRRQYMLENPNKIRQTFSFSNIYFLPWHLTKLSWHLEKRVATLLNTCIIWIDVTITL